MNWFYKMESFDQLRIIFIFSGIISLSVAKITTHLESLGEGIVLGFITFVFVPIMIALWIPDQ